jgi:hypothetical protein
MHHEQYVAGKASTNATKNFSWFREVASSAARWYIFKPKNPIWVNFVGPWNWKGWYVYSMAIWNILRPLGICYGHLVIFWIFGIFSPGLVYCVKKNLATLAADAVFMYSLQLNSLAKHGPKIGWKGDENFE